MVIDFKALKAAHKNQVTPDNLFMLVLGIRGAGKSSLIGTLNTPTLFLYATNENHGKNAALALSKNKDNLTPYCLNMNEKGEIDSLPENKPDVALNRLLEILSTPGLEKEFKAVALDSLSALDPYVYMSSDVQKATKFDQTKVTKQIYDRILSKLKQLYFKGVDIIVTCASEVEIGRDGELDKLTPSLRGTGTFSEVTGQFDDIVVVGPVTVTEEDGTSETQRKLQFKPDVQKSGKKYSGQPVTVSFKPRLTGITENDLPAYTSPDLSKLKEWKNLKKAGK